MGFVEELLEIVGTRIGAAAQIAHHPVVVPSPELRKGVRVTLPSAIGQIPHGDEYARFRARPKAEPPQLSVSAPESAGARAGGPDLALGREDAVGPHEVVHDPSADRRRNLCDRVVSGR